MVRVLVIFPEIPARFESSQWIYPNYTLIQLGTILKDAGHDPVILNIPQSKMLGDHDPRFIDVLEKIPIACISAYSFQLNVVRDLVKRLKEKEMHVLLGGALASTSPEEALHFCHADYAIEGEGDVALPKLLEFIVEGKGTLDGIENVWYLRNGQLKFTFKSFIDNLDDLPLPDFTLQNYKEMYSKIFKKIAHTFFPLESSRGCYANCNFCSSKHIMGNWRKKTARRMLDELHLFRETYPRLFKRQNFGIIYVDNTATADPKRMLEFSRLKQEENLEIPWACMGRINEFVTSRKELIQEMVKSRNLMIFFGIEAGYDEGLREINKKITIEQINTAINLCLDAGLAMLNLSFIVGFPWETLEDIEKTIAYAKRLKQIAPNRIVTSISRFLLFKRTPIYETLKQEHAPELNLDELTSLDLIKRNWNEHVPDYALLQKVREFRKERVPDAIDRTY